MCCSAAEIVSNGGFEVVENGKAKGWTLPAYYSYAPGMGRNGTTAIAYSFVTNRSLLAPVAQPLSLEPSETYRVSCWVRTEGVKPPKGEPGTKIGVEWKEADGRSHGTYSKSISGTTDWTQISFITPQDKNWHDTCFLSACRSESMKQTESEWSTVHSFL